MTVDWSASSSTLSNNQIRKNFIRLRKNLSQKTLQANSNALFNNIASLDLSLQNKKIASYLAVKGEINNWPLHQNLFKHNQSVFLPIIKNKTLVFAEVNELTPLKKNPFNILEPDVNTTVMLDTIDIIFIPLTAFKKDGNRLGMGGGYYDKTIGNTAKSKRPLLIGLAHNFQNHENFTTHAWDIQLDMIITEQHVYFKKSA